MFTITLPLELLTEIFKYNEDDYTTLYSCILVNKEWHNIIIPILWRYPFYSVDSIKIIVNCLLEEDKDFLTRNGIELIFELLEKPPLYNYAKFCTELQLLSRIIFDGLVKKASRLNILLDRLVKFILDHSAAIKEFSTFNMGCYWANNHQFDNNFQNLNKLECKFTDSSKFIDKLANICKCIQSLHIHYNTYNNKFDCSLTQLIKAQNQIKKLTIISYTSQALSDNFKQAIFTHSQSIIYYSGIRKKHTDQILLPMFKNLKILSLKSTSRHGTNNQVKWLKNIPLPNIESVEINIHYQPFLSDLSGFININGKFLKNLNVDGIPDDDEFLGMLFQSIAQCCKNLEYLSIFYKDEVDQELMKVFNNCMKLESIEFKQLDLFSVEKIDVDRILAVLIQTLPKKLKSIIINHQIANFSSNSFDILVKNWRKLKPFTIKFERISEIQKLVLLAD